jgi:L-alanine-DL-glutamate epimerase-like enolase superfamily enzyme
MLKITAIETLQSPSYGNIVWVLVHTDTGHTGLGETFRGADAVVAHVHSGLAPSLIGRNPLEIESLSAEMLDPYVGYRSSSAEIRAASAIDIALHDLIGKYRKCPVYELVGGLFRKQIRTYNTCAGTNYNRSGTRKIVHATEARGEPETFDDQDAVARDPAALARSLLDQGITGMKIWPFDEFASRSSGSFISASDVETGCEPLRLIRAAVGSEMDLMLEMHGMWSLPAAMRIAQAASAFNLLWVEDPLKAVNPQALATFAQRAGVPVCASETLATSPAYLELLQCGALDYVMIDLSWCGGLTEAKRIAALASAFQRPVTTHDCTGPVVFAAGIHLALSTRNVALQESVRAYYNGWYQDIVTVVPRPDKGYFAAPAGIGLGTELRPEFLARPDLIRRVTTAPR